ncbi:MAG: type II toxin-antitoxin system VapB family antitoxin [Spirochaetales bacterium]|nr:type II toxin-antitoxin system VapB family antitoxin [Spirochaetales bacterium]
MRTNIVLDDNLVDEAFRLADDIRTKRELLDAALREFVNVRKARNLKELKGKIAFAEGYDHKAMRSAG